ncbi:MAG TPA: TetR/AcrR family transcriptional regulator [Desulfosalsimonadaceae bacterium]|nr:TetR/AcrR family transcriptional regulator [Desulfosalsimonadaceae bacterium]
MSKGEITRQRIIEKAADLFNSHGFVGASMSQLMADTGLNKGGIYNHFKNKEEILTEAFSYSVSVVEEKIIREIQTEKTALGQLKRAVEFFRDYPENPVVKGGCPILNSIVYSDNSLPVFESQVRQVVSRIIENFEAIINSAIQEKAVREDIDAKEEAALIFSMIEGGVAISRNLGNSRYMDIVIDHVITHIDNHLAG